MNTYYFTHKGSEFKVDAEDLCKAWNLAKEHIGLSATHNSPDDLLIRGFLTHPVGKPNYPKDIERLHPEKS